MKTDELREKYLEFYESKGHTRRPSDVLVPHGDPSVLFTPAGMNQFKDHFLGKVKLDYTKATTCQKCLRTGDIENVGRTAYHHTFFEMLGNFSFGDYFKRDAIHWAWEFLTDPKWLALDAKRLSVTVYLDDDEAAKIWSSEVGLPDNKIVRMDEDENFWPASAPSQGPDGVCGPCSEIYYLDDSDKEVEIWNLVFTQFNRVGDPPENLRPLPSKNIDTGMGLERTAAVLQGVDTNYHIDSLQPIVDAAAEICGRKYEPASEDGRRLRRITDHLRTCTFAIHENVEPGPKKQSYVIRRLLRRAVLDGHQMGISEPILYQLVDKINEVMRTPYPELSETAERVAETIKAEETAFLGNIDDGLARINHMFASMKASQRVLVDGREAATLYTTYGVPPELVEQEANEIGFSFDWDGYKSAMLDHGKDSGGDKFELFQAGGVESIKSAVRTTEFVGYDAPECNATVKGIVLENKAIDVLAQTDTDSQIIIVLDQSPFYGESGGQVGDTGKIFNENFEFIVSDTQKNSDLLLHFGTLTRGTIKAGEQITAQVDSGRRQGLCRAHSATHLLHHALQQNVGQDAQQRGSKVEDDCLRFDFKTRSQIAADVLSKIEADVNEKVASGDEIGFDFMPIEDARKRGAMMLFGEKYPDVVRMVSVGEFSKELCGGTHLTNTRDVGDFEIVSEEAVSAGTRRIVAYTGERAKSNAQKTRSELEAISDLLSVPVPVVSEHVTKLVQTVRNLKKQLSSGKQVEETVDTSSKSPNDAQLSYLEIRAALRNIARTLNVPLFETCKRVQNLIHEVSDLKSKIEQLEQTGDLSADALIEQAEMVGDVRLITLETPGANPNLMRQLIDQVRKKTNPVAIFLGAGQGSDKVMLVAGVSKDLVQKGVSAGDWVKQIAPIVGGGGGGKPDLAQAGGKNLSELPHAIAEANRMMVDKLAP